MSDFLQRLGIRHPIFLAPMGAGPGTPELAAAVADAGGLGSIAGAYLKADDLRQAVSRFRALTKRPLNVNLFAGGDQTSSKDPARMLAILNDVHQRLGIEPPQLPKPEPNRFEEGVETILELRPEVFSFTFGVPRPDVIRRMHAKNITVIGTATTVEEAVALQKAEIDAVVAQGEEAGAHRGTFIGSFERSMVPVLDLVEEIALAVSIPVIAAGAIMDGRDIADALDRGAIAAQLGTAFLACPESGAPEAYKRALLDARQDTTVVTRAFSGRHARGLANEFIDMVPQDAILPFPTQHLLTRPMRIAAAKQGEPGFLSLWAGRGVTRIRQMPAAELMQTLLRELQDASPQTLRPNR